MKTILLKPNGTGRYDDVSPFIMTNGQLDLKIILPNQNGDFFLVTENNGTKRKYDLPGSGSVTLENLEAGELLVTVKHYLNGVMVKQYEVEPLILCEVDDGLKCTPEFVHLQKQIDEIKKTYDTIKNDHATLIGVLKLAWEDYKVNPFLDGTSWESFVEKYGIAFLTADEIKEIKGENDHDKD